jgi:hypothetical protein
VDPIRLFSSKNSLNQIQLELKQLQESCLVGLLRGADDSSRRVIASNLYSSYCQWRRINIIRTLIYSILRPYAGAIVAKENDTLGRREMWKTRVRLRQNIATHWMLFYARIPSATAIQLPKSIDPESLALKMHVEIDQCSSPDFSRYINKMHSRLCFLSYIPSMIRDLYFLLAEGSHFTVHNAIQAIAQLYPAITQESLSTIFIKNNRLLEEFNLIMNQILRLYTTQSWVYNKIGITQSWASLSVADKELRMRLARAMSENISAISELIITAIPLFSLWMTQYVSIAAHYDVPLSDEIKRAELRISQLTDNAEEFDQKYMSIIRALSTEPGVPGLIDLIDLCVNLNRQSDHSHFFMRRKAKRIYPNPVQKLGYASIILTPESSLPVTLEDAADSFELSDDSSLNSREGFIFSDDGDSKVESIQQASYCAEVRAAESSLVESSEEVVDGNSTINSPYSLFETCASLRDNMSDGSSLDLNDYFDGTDSSDSLRCTA